MEENRADQPVEIDMTTASSPCHGIVFFKMQDILNGEVHRFPVDVMMAGMMLSHLSDQFEDDKEHVQAMIGLVQELSGEVKITVSSYDAEAFFRHVVIACDNLKKKLPILPQKEPLKEDGSGDS